MAGKLNLNVVNCVLLVVILILVIVLMAGSGLDFSEGYGGVPDGGPVGRHTRRKRGKKSGWGMNHYLGKGNYGVKEGFRNLGQYGGLKGTVENTKVVNPKDSDYLKKKTYTVPAAVASKRDATPRFGKKDFR